MKWHGQGLFIFGQFLTIALDFAKKINFCKIANFYADSKRRAQELSNDVPFVIIGHQTWDLPK